MSFDVSYSLLHNHLGESMTHTPPPLYNGSHLQPNKIWCLSFFFVPPPPPPTTEHLFTVSSSTLTKRWGWREAPLTGQLFHSTVSSSTLTKRWGWREAPLTGQLFRSTVSSSTLTKSDMTTVISCRCCGGGGWCCCCHYKPHTHTQKGGSTLTDMAVKKLRRVVYSHVIETGWSIATS